MFKYLYICSVTLSMYLMYIKCCKFIVFMGLHLDSQAILSFSNADTVCIVVWLSLSQLKFHDILVCAEFRMCGCGPW